MFPNFKQRTKVVENFSAEGLKKVLDNIIKKKDGAIMQVLKTENSMEYLIIYMIPND